MKNTLPEIVLLGAGGFAREAYCWMTQYNVVAFYSEGAPKGQEVFGIPVISSLNGYSGASFLPAIGTPQIKEKLWSKAVESGLKPCSPIIHKSCVLGRNVEIGEGSILCPGSIVTTGINIGVGFLLNLQATVGHDCRIGAFVTVSPGALISGNVRIGDLAYIGTGSCIREKLSVGRGATLGMGATLTKEIPADEIWVGQPAAKMQKK